MLRGIRLVPIHEPIVVFVSACHLMTSNVTQKLIIPLQRNKYYNELAVSVDGYCDIALNNISWSLLIGSSTFGPWARRYGFTLSGRLSNPQIVSLKIKFIGFALIMWCASVWSFGHGIHQGQSLNELLTQFNPSQVYFSQPVPYFSLLVQSNHDICSGLAARWTNIVPIAIQIRWKIHLTLTSILTQWSV